MTALCVAAMLTAAATAEARPGYEMRQPSMRLTMLPRASQGYLVTVTTKGRRAISLTAARGPLSVTYRTTGTVGPGGIEAELGRLGRLSVRFHAERSRPPLRRSEPPRPRCSGRSPRFALGSFSGTIRFRGEGGFTRIEARRAPGVLERTFLRVCQRRGPARRAEDRTRLTVLAAVERSRNRRLGFQAVGVSLGPGTSEVEEPFFVTAIASERREGMRIQRVAFDLAEEGAVLVSPPGAATASGTVALPAPFSGGAELRDEPAAAAIWSGSLTARLPGAGVVGLTGERFRAGLCRFAAADYVRNRCLRRIGIPLPSTRLGEPIAAPVRRALRRAGF